MHNLPYTQSISLFMHNVSSLLFTMGFIFKRIFRVSKASTEIHFPFSFIHSWVWSVNATATSLLLKLYFKRFQHGTFLRRPLKITFWTQNKNYLASSCNSTQNVKEGEAWPKPLKRKLWKASKFHQPPRRMSFQDAVQTLHMINTFE